MGIKITSMIMIKRDATMPDPANRRAGFTLVEILVVITIMAILATVVAVNVGDKPGQAKVKAAGIQLKNLKTALTIYRTEQGQLPTLQQGLAALASEPTVAPLPERYPQDGYLDSSKVPLDPWGNEFIYLVPGRTGRSFELLCYGKDGEPGGFDEDADLSSDDL